MKYFSKRGTMKFTHLFLMAVALLSAASMFAALDICTKLKKSYDIIARSSHNEEMLQIINDQIEKNNCN